MAFSDFLGNKTAYRPDTENVWVVFNKPTRQVLKVFKEFFRQNIALILIVQQNLAE
jgi:hypothetical protein